MRLSIKKIFPFGADKETRPKWEKVYVRPPEPQSFRVPAKEKTKAKIQSILNVWETGTPFGDYGDISIYKDGPNRRRQITYGKSQTTEWGNLRKLIQMYIKADGRYAASFAAYVNKIGRESLVDNGFFLNLLDGAGEDPIMWKTQDEFFDKVYWEPAMKWAKAEGFVLPLSHLVIYDSYIHSGKIHSFLRKRFAELTPAHGGDEKKWIQAYIDTRDDWLANHSNRILRRTTYRTRDMIREIQMGHWELGPSFMANGTLVS